MHCSVVVNLLLLCWLAMGRQLSPRVSTTTFDENSRVPLAVLRTSAAADGAGASSPVELRVFPDDPNWAFEVVQFMVAAGAEAQGVEDALTKVNEVSWADGRTFRGKHLVLLAFAEDVRRDGDESRSCRLSKAVLAASRHTTEAHLILVASGFELDAATRETLEGVLGDRGWRSFISIEVPEFEGFSSAINRAMRIVPGYSVVAVVSTSALLLPARTADTLADAGSATLGGTSNNSVSGEDTETDVFVAYERMRSTGACIPFDAAEGTSGTVGVREKDCSRGDQHGLGCRESRIGREGGLLVTAISLDGVRRLSNETGGGISAEEKGGSCEATRLSDVAPLPLLLFDEETLLALGELDERFSFQGGIAEWISRADSGSGDCDQGGSTNVGVCCRGASSSQRRRRCSSFDKSCPAAGRGDPRGSPLCSDGTVRHVHAREWDGRLVGSWPGDDVGARRSRDSAGERGAPPERCPGVDCPEKGGLKGGAGTAEERPRSIGESPASEGVTIDPWNRLSPARLESLVQADADLFFLPLLLEPPVGAASQEGPVPVDSCIAFHSEWMRRAPDKHLSRGAVARRQQFPVAAVVVVHDDISLMRATLEEVAVVVECILVVVSLTPWHGDTGDMAPTLDLLRAMLGDVDSPTRGKLWVEVGSWATESEQREYGNALIRDDPREFFRVVVIDTDEFWHPVVLAKALVLAAQHPEAVEIRAEMDTYWQSVRSVVSPPETLKALWLVDPYRCIWCGHREVMCKVKVGDQLVASEIARSLGVVHHLSYVRVEEDLKRKMRTFSHAGEQNSGWYERSWLGWAANNSLTDLHPVVPEAYKRAVAQPLLRLTPALRALHLEANKGTSGPILFTGSTVDRDILLPPRASTTGTASKPESEDKEGFFRETHCQRDGTFDGGTDLLSEQGLQREQQYSKCAHRIDAAGKARRPAGRAGRSSEGGVWGCEGNSSAQWTVWQRIMCLIPDGEGGAEL